MDSSTSPTLQRLYRLRKSSPDFHRTLEAILKSPEYEVSARNLEGDDVVALVDFLDDVLNDSKLPNATFQVCLAKLRAICGSKNVIPRSCTLSSAVLNVSLDPCATGGYGDIYQATLGGSRVRVKRVRIPHPKQLEDSQKAFCEFVVTWKRLKHPNVLPVLGFTLSPLQIASSWMPNGNLPDYIKKNRGADVVGLLLDVAKGLDYLHSCGVIHGELKGSNVLVDASRHARISDFGLSTVTSRDNFAMGSYQPEYSPRWSAPEVLSEKAYSNLSDIFSFGMLMFEVFSGSAPLMELPGFNAALAILAGKRPPRPTHAAVTGRLWELMERCWDPEPRMRPEAKEVIRILSAPSASRPHG